MATQQELDKVYMQNAVNLSTLSHAIRKKVGCILVTPENLQIGAYNGQPSGWDNVCEDTHTTDDPHFKPSEYLVTKSTVIHAELNAILHAADKVLVLKALQSTFRYHLALRVQL